jgi:hypothetical protein
MTATIKPDKGRTIEFGEDKTLIEYKEGQSYDVAKVEDGVVWLIHPDKPGVPQPFIVVEDIVMKDEE